MAPPEIPADGTFFDTLKKSFVNVPVDASKNNAVATTEFLEAAESLVTLFEVLGSAAFSPVKSDMTGNIKVCQIDGTDNIHRQTAHVQCRKSVTDNSPPQTSRRLSRSL